MPGSNPQNARDELSYTAVLAHEFTHFLRSKSVLLNYTLEEVATHVQAAEISSLNEEDRCSLLGCAVEILLEYRFKECR
jgi:hypothetical protein